jgi:hypothetical protein
MRPNSAAPAGRELSADVDIKNLDDETEFVLEKFREGLTTMELK